MPPAKHCFNDRSREHKHTHTQPQMNRQNTPPARCYGHKLRIQQMKSNVAWVALLIRLRASESSDEDVRRTVDDECVCWLL